MRAITHNRSLSANNFFREGFCNNVDKRIIACDMRDSSSVSFSFSYLSHCFGNQYRKQYHHEVKMIWVMTGNKKNSITTFAYQSADLDSVAVDRSLLRKID